MALATDDKNDSMTSTTGNKNGSMILKTDDKNGKITLDGKELPGIFQHMSVNGEVLVDSNASVGNNTIRKVMRGFGDNKIVISLILLPKRGVGEDIDIYEQLGELHQLFRSVNEGVPKCFNIAHPHLTSRGITGMIF
ncbi:MAG: hypothetical protein ACRCY4_07070, partial [Brevinema sp.]